MTEERTAPAVVESDVIVVGAGPGGSATAKWLADRGLNVSLLEKSTFPRDKVCGDGLTPRATKQLIRLGVDVSTEAGWVHNIGLRTYGAHGAVRVPVARAGLLPQLRPHPPARRLRRDARPLAVTAGRHLVRGHQRVRADPRRPPRPHRRRPGQGRPRVPRPDRGGRRRQLQPDRARDGPGEEQAAPHGCRGARLLPLARAHDSDFIESCLELWDGEAGGVQPPARLRVDVPARRRH
jgi:hypothetical protein